MKLSSRWLPAVIAPVLVAGAVAVPALASADAPLPERSPADVLAMVADSGGVAYSGLLTATSDLGLPDLGSAGGSVRGSDDDAVAALQMLTGSHSLRVYTDGAAGQRIQILDQLAERDLIRDGDDVWAYDSATNEAEHIALPSPSGAPARPSTSPIDAARQLVEAVASSTDVAVTTTGSVAGRSVYELRLTPKSDTTLVRQVMLSVDSETGLPLKIQIDGLSGPAATIEFSSIDFAAPDASLFSFTPPAGATVIEADPPQRGADEGIGSASRPSPRVIGTGWDAIVELPAGTVDAGAVWSDQGGIADALLTPVGDGRAIETSLLTVLVTGDGRVLAGAVPLSALEAAAG